MGSPTRSCGRRSWPSRATPRWWASTWGKSIRCSTSPPRTPRSWPPSASWSSWAASSSTPAIAAGTARPGLSRGATAPPGCPERWGVWGPFRGPQLGKENAAVDVDGLPGDVGAVGQAELAHDGGDLLRAAEPPERCAMGAHPGWSRAGAGAAHGVDGAGRHAVHADVVLGQLHRQRVREAGEAGLRRADVGAARRAEERGHAAERHDAAAAPAVDHVRRRRLHGEERAVERHRQHAMPLLQAHLKELRLLADGRVADEEVDPTERAHA